MNNQELIASVVAEVMNRLKAPPAVPPKPARSGPPAPVRAAAPGSGVFETAGEAALAARAAQEQLAAKGIGARAEIVNLVKEICSDQAEAWGQLEFNETRIGRLDHKIEKLRIVKWVPGIEWLAPHGLSGDRGITLEELAPFGVIAAITPVTHSIPTLAGNIVSMVAAGNGVVFNAHPGAAQCAAEAVAFFNRAIQRQTGIANLVTIVREPSLDSFAALCRSEEVDLLCVTGGPGVVKAAMRSGKRAICAGPGNPPVVVDETADLELAAASIIKGAAYDNNLLCIGEKQVFAVDSIYRGLMDALKKVGAHLLNQSQVRRLAGEVFTQSSDAGGCSRPVLNRDHVGADAALLAKVAGADCPPGTELLIGESPFECPFVQEEQMMPMIPVVRARDTREAIDMAVRSEHGHKHSAIMHSKNLDNLTLMGRRMDTSLFVKNGPSVAGLGLGGEGYLNYSIATTTGEGIVTTATFTRRRRCVLVDNLNVVA